MFDPLFLGLIVAKMIGLILSVTVHEFGHAWVADRLGDRLPRHQGRVTLNPMAHADPIGTLAFPLLGLILTQGRAYGFGWGRPVQINPVGFTRRLRMKHGHMLVALAGPAMNILFAVLISLLLVAGVRLGFLEGRALQAVLYVIYLNFGLAFFNLLPVPPLDGGAVLAGLLPDRAAPVLDTMQRYGMFILFFFIAWPPASVLYAAPAQWTFGAWMGVMQRLLLLLQ